MTDAPFIARGSCDNCPALTTNASQNPACGLGRATRAVRVYSDLSTTGDRHTIAPAGKCKRPRTISEFVLAFRK